MDMCLDEMNMTWPKAKNLLWKEQKIQDFYEDRVDIKFSWLHN